MYRLAGRAAVRANARYQRLMGAALLFITLGSIAVTISTWRPEYHMQASLIAAALFGIGLLSVLIIQIGHLPDEAFRARALAISIKSLAWRYMAKAPPFEPGISSFEVDNRYLSLLRSLHGAAEAIGGPPRSAEPSKEEITTRMREIRAQPLQKRRASYFVGRVARQRTMEDLKGANSLKGTRVFGLMVGTALTAAVATAVYQSVNPLGLGQMAAPIATLSTALIAWFWLNRTPFNTSISKLAAYELELIAGKEPSVQTDRDLSRLAADAELAIDRQYSMWAARR
jgi:hypothetical protein